MDRPKIEFLPVQSLSPHPKNTRTHKKKQIQLLGESIDKFGFTAPILIDPNGTILAGHARWEAAKLRKHKTVPVIRILGLTDAERRAYVLADNKLAEMAGYDRPALAVELQELSTLLSPEEFKLTGFEPAELDALLESYIDSEREPADDVPPPMATAVCQTGDVFTLGRHRLLCADARVPELFRQLMGKDCAAMILTDPPYNVSIGQTVGRGRIKHREFKMASGEMTPADYTGFLTSVFKLCAESSKDGSIHMYFSDWRHLREMTDAGETVFGDLKNLIVWNKTNAGQGSFYRSQHELIFVYKSGDAEHTNNVQLGRYGRNRSNVWTYAGANSFRKGRIADLTAHPTLKPVAMLTDAMRDCTRRNEIVLDPFVGSGSVFLAAERVGRRAYGIEIDPLYADLAIRRWQVQTKSDAILKGTQKTFDQLAISRTERSKRRGAQ